MAKAAPAPTNDAPAMSFVARPMSELPKREPPKAREFDAASANALLALVSVDGQTATDGATYAEIKDARSKANQARRLLEHVKPEGKDIKTRVYSPEGTEGFAWAIFLAPHKDRKPRKANGAS